MLVTCYRSGHVGSLRLFYGFQGSLTIQTTPPRRLFALGMTQSSTLNADVSVWSQSDASEIGPAIRPA
eukprot:3182899-Prymnesium_polylepis.1